jgi:hypothetical protein
MTDLYDVVYVDQSGSVMFDKTLNDTILSVARSYLNYPEGLMGFSSSVFVYEENHPKSGGGTNLQACFDDFIGAEQGLRALIITDGKTHLEMDLPANVDILTLTLHKTWVKGPRIEKKYQPKHLKKD